MNAGLRNMRYIAEWTEAIAVTDLRQCQRQQRERKSLMSKHTIIVLGSPNIDYLLRRCKAKWMMAIKNTDFILSLYARANLNIKTFDKTYLVSFMNRNDKKAEHLIVMNY